MRRTLRVSASSEIVAAAPPMSTDTLNAGAGACCGVWVFRVEPGRRLRLRPVSLARAGSARAPCAPHGGAGWVGPCDV